MIFLLHSNARTFYKAIMDDKELFLENSSLTGAFWELAQKYPEELIIWRDRHVDLQVADDLKESFTHELIMASYAVENQIISDQIGYIDQLPFVNLNYDVIYPTWMMSSDIGGIYGKTALKFEEQFNPKKNFGFILNSIAKTGQQNGLFCYSNPKLVKNKKNRKIRNIGGEHLLFSFVAQHYKKEWLWVLFFCLWKYEKKIKLFSLIKTLNKKSYFKKHVCLPIKEIQQKDSLNEVITLDVVIPTFFRAEHVKNLLKDLSEQSKLPSRVIIVEQDPNPKSKSQLYFLTQEWPFEVIHHFIHRTGACYARNLAMKSVTADYIFFADDDIRINKHLLEDTLLEINRLGVGCINLNCLQPGENSVFHNVKQWGAFGSGTSVVISKFALSCRFSEEFEYGYGEDADFGMQLREAGCDIIYHPDLKIHHLKAPIGGFRKKPVVAWEIEDPQPKPSPTIMMLVKRYYTGRQIKGFKTSLYLKYFKNQKNKNPFTYLKQMERNWKKSEAWAEKISVNNHTEL